MTQLESSSTKGTQYSLANANQLNNSVAPNIASLPASPYQITSENQTEASANNQFNINNNNYQNFGPGDPPLTSNLGNGYQVGIGLSFKLGQRNDSGYKIEVFAEKTMSINNNFDARVGLGLNYYSNFNGTGKKGYETRESAALDYNNGKFDATIGTNTFAGHGELEQFSQQTGYLNASYETSRQGGIFV